MKTGITVIIPCYNRAVFLREAIESVLSQGYDGPLEIIVADDGSTDQSVAVAESFGSPVIVLRKPEGCMSQGPGPTRNRAITASTQPYIAFLDSDDVFMPGHLERLASALDEDPKLGLAFDDAEGMNSHGTQSWMRPYPECNLEIPETVFLDPFFQTSAVMLKRDIFSAVGGPFDEDLWMAEDVDLWLRIFENGSVRHVPGTGSRVREHDGRMVSAQNIRKTYHYAKLVMERAIARYPYHQSVIRRRKAAIDFRMAQADWLEKKYVPAIFKLILSGIKDPVRGIKTVFAKCRNLARQAGLSRKRK